MSGTFELLETIRWTPRDGFFLLERHIDRIARSARHFGYACHAATLREALDRGVASSAEPLRLRLLVARDGAPRVERAVLSPAAAPARVKLADAPIDPASEFLYHKTTNRKAYEDAKSAAGSGVDDVILWNPDRQITESTIANVVVEIGGRKITPPVDCGLLPGTFRAQLLDEGAIEEGIVTIDGLKAAPRLWLVNSVRAWWPAQLV